MATIPKIVADFEVQLATAVAVGATSFSISSNVDDDGVTIPNGLYYFVLDNASSNKEYVSGTLSGTSVTGVKTVSRQGVETSGTIRSHRIGSTVTLNDFATYKAYMDAIGIAGASNATQSLQGVVELATAAEIDADTATGGTGAALVPTPDQLVLSKYYLRLPSVAEKTALAGLTGLTGSIVPTARRSAPSGYLLCDGSLVSRSTYADLFAAICPSAVFTVTIATPAVFTKVAHGLVAGDKLHFTTTGALPTGLSTNTDYYVIATGLTSDNFRVSTSRGGSAVNTTGSQSGVHTFYISNYGKGDGSTTFALPDMRGFTPFGYKSSDANFDVLNVPNTYVGEKTHVLTIGELAAHSHPITAVINANSGGVVNASNTSSNRDANVTSTDSVGSSNPHNTMPPYVVVNFIIKT